MSRKTPGEVQGSNHSPHRARHLPSGSVCALRRWCLHMCIIARPALYQKERTMSHTHSLNPHRVGIWQARCALPHSQTRTTAPPGAAGRALEDHQLLATISGQVFDDLDLDGLKDGGESARAAGRSTSMPTATANSAPAKPPRARLPTAATASTAWPPAPTVQQPGWQQTSPTGVVPSIERLSVAADGTQGNSASSPYGMSADGRYVGFFSDASNLVDGDTNGGTGRIRL